jgi:uncharacterized membrane protein YbhN (UPF0104 family)
VSDATPAPAPRHRWPWFVLLVALGGLGVYVGAPEIESLGAAWHRLAGVPVITIAIVIGGALGLVATEALRIAAIGRLVGVKLSPRDAWDAAVANHVMTAITPNVGLGEPTVAYLLGKRGIPWDAAVAIPFIKFTTSLAFVFVIGAALWLAGFGPPVERWLAASGIAVFVAIAVITTVVVVVSARPRLARRVIAVVRGWFARRRCARSSTSASCSRCPRRGALDRAKPLPGCSLAIWSRRSTPSSSSPCSGRPRSISRSRSASSTCRSRRPCSGGDDSERTSHGCPDTRPW